MCYSVQGDVFLMHLGLQQWAITSVGLPSQPSPILFLHYVIADHHCGILLAEGIAVKFYPRLHFWPIIPYSWLYCSSSCLE
jgi:hypothetical protein